MAACYAHKCHVKHMLCSARAVLMLLYQDDLRIAGVDEGLVGAQGLAQGYNGAVHQGDIDI